MGCGSSSTEDPNQGQNQQISQESIMVNYKLIYFSLTGKGEIMRMMFALAGVEFEDYRITYGDWPKF